MFYGHTLGAVCSDKPSFHQANGFVCIGVRRKPNTQARECYPTRQFDIKLLNGLLQAEALWPPSSRGACLQQQGGVCGEQRPSGSGLCCSVRLCASVLFWPKARKILAIAAINTMNFFCFITGMLPKRKIKQNRGRTSKAAIKIKGDSERGFKAELPRSSVRLNGIFENRITVMGPRHCCGCFHRWPPLNLGSSERFKTSLETEK